MLKTGIKQKILSLCLLLNLTLFSVISPVVVLAESKTSVAAPAIEDSSTVDRLSGINRYETAVKIAQRGWKNTSEYAILAAGMDHNLVDALAAIPLAKLKNAPLLLTEGDNLNTYTEAELKRLEVKTVYVVSGEAVLTKKVLNKLAEMGIKVISLGGVDRFETAVNIAHELGNPTKIVITTAWTNADALSVAPIAAAQGMPILYSDVHKLPDCVSSYLEGIKENVVISYVIGGQAVLSDSIKNALPNSIRVSGVDRYETNLEILKTFANSLSYRNTYIANGEDGHLVDALAGAPLAAITSSPLLLASQQMTDSARNYVKLNLSPTIIALGGQAALSTDVVNQLTSVNIITERDSVEGSEDVNKPKELTDNLKIIANNVIVENVSTPYSISIQGNNTILKNVTVKGTVFVDPGEKGTTTLDNVTAGKIVVLSGASESIHLKNIFAEILRIASSNNVRIETSGATNIRNTFVSSNAVLDVVGGSVGRVEITNVSNGLPFTIELRGTFDQPVLVSSGATVRAGVSANISSLEIAPENSKQIVTLEGSFNKVEVNALAIINLSANALLNELITNAKTDIDAVSGARVVNYDNSGNEGTITGTGAQTLFSGTATSSGGGTSASSDGSSETTISSVPTETTSVAMSAFINSTQIRLNMRDPLDENTFVHLSQNGFSVSSGTITEVYYMGDSYHLISIHIYGNGFTSNTIVNYDGLSGIADINGNLIGAFSVRTVTDKVNIAPPMVNNFGVNVQTGQVIANSTFTFAEPVTLQVAFSPTSYPNRFYSSSSYLSTVNDGDIVLDPNLFPPQTKIWYRTVDLAGNGSAWIQDGAVPVINESLLSISDRPSPALDLIVGSAGAVDAGATVSVYSDASLTNLVGAAVAAGDGSFSVNLTDGVFGTNYIYYIRETTVNGNVSGSVQKYYTSGYKYEDNTTIRLTMNSSLDPSSFAVGSANGFSVSGSTTSAAIYAGSVITITGTGFTSEATVSYNGTSLKDTNNNLISGFSIQPFADLLNQAPPDVAKLGTIGGYDVIATSAFTFAEPVKLQVYYGSSPDINSTPASTSTIYLTTVPEGKVIISATIIPDNSSIWYRTVDQSGHVSNWIQDGVFKNIDNPKIRFIDRSSPESDVVVGEAGAVEPGAKLDIYSSWDKTHPITVIAGPDGSFEANLVDGIFMKYYHFSYYETTVEGNKSLGRVSYFVGGYNFVNSTTIILSMNKKLDANSFAANSPNGFTVKVDPSWTTPNGVVIQVTSDGSFITITGTGFSNDMIIAYDGSAGIKYADGSSVGPFSFHFPWW